MNESRVWFVFEDDCEGNLRACCVEKIALNYTKLHFKDGLAEFWCIEVRLDERVEIACCTFIAQTNKCA